MTRPPDPGNPRAPRPWPAAAAAAGVAAFGAVAVWVVTGASQPLDDAVMAWVAGRQRPWLVAALRELTYLGTATVVVALALVAALLLASAGRRAEARRMAAAALGAVALNSLLKLAFDRPRPHAFAWGTYAATTSFPSGHATSAAAVYGTAALLAGRMSGRRRVRVGAGAGAALVVGLVGASRVYLGVHYPSDVLGGAAVGWAWAAVCGGRERRPYRGDPGASPASMRASTRS